MKNITTTNRLNLMVSIIVILIAWFSSGSFCLNTANAKEVELKGIEGKVDILLPGGPYGLAGNRMVFTNWYYVHPCGFSWHDKQGKPLQNMDWTTSIGPWDAEFRGQGITPRGIRLVVQPAQRLGPLVQPQYPWEQHGISFCTVIKDGNIYKAWGPCEDADRKRRMAYYESKDGVKWTRPKLGIVEYKGSRENNLLEFDPGYGGDPFWGWGVFNDTCAPADQRYKATKNGVVTHEDFAKYRQKWPDDWEPKALMGRGWSAVLGAVSHDGLHWEILPEPISVEFSDTQPVVYYDRLLKKYVLYTRHHMIGPRSEQAPGKWRGWTGFRRRAIGRTESSDFRHFEPSEPIIRPGPNLLPSDHFYNNSRTSIPGAPDHHLMFPAVWGYSDDTTTILLASSYDGRLWDFVPGPPVLTTAAFGQWDGGCVFSHPDMVELPDGTFALPYTGYKYPHKYPRRNWRFWPGYATWPKGRIVALQAQDRGQFTTVSFMPPGSKLRINAVTARAGKILVEVAGDKQRSFDDCDPIVGDQHFTTVTWKGKDDLGFKEGAAIMLRFKMKKAKIFGLQFD